MSAGLQKRRDRRNNRRIDWVRIFARIHPQLLTLLVAVILSYVLIGALEARLRPILLTAAQVQTRNAVTEVLEGTVREELTRQAVSYTDLVRVERGQDGSITAIVTDMNAMNRLRTAIMESLLRAMDGLDERAIAIPFGTLIDSELLWGRGPTIKVRSFTVGTVTAEFESEFLSAGVNQTLHKIWLRVCVPTTILLPGARPEITTDTRLCIAETVIVGKVPSYLQKVY